MTFMRLPFQPTPASFAEWLAKFPIEQRMQAALFLASSDGRAAAASVADDTVVAMIEAGISYSDIADAYNWTVSNVQRRATRSRDRHGTKREPRPRRVEGEPAGRRQRAAKRMPSAVASTTPPPHAAGRRAAKVTTPDFVAPSGT